MFNEHILTCFIDDAVGMEIRHHLNLDHIHWECDYPHSDSTWPTAPEMAMKYLERAARRRDQQDHPPQRHAGTSSYDPFAHIPREQCTVGALRAQAPDVDTTPVSHGTGKFQDEGIVTAMTLAERIAAAGKEALTDAPFRVLPALDDDEPLLLDVGRRRHPPLPALPVLRLLPAPAAAALSVVRRRRRRSPRP